MSNQPVWKCVAQIGDATPLDYGGLWVFIDTTGVYPPEGELYDADTRQVRRFILEDCTYTNGILSDNKFHPNLPAWFADEMGAVAETMGTTSLNLINQFCSSDPVTRADAWRCIGDYFGWDNLDSYPLTLTRREAARRYNQPVYEVTP